MYNNENLLISNLVHIHSVDVMVITAPLCLRLSDEFYLQLKDKLK